LTSRSELLTGVRSKGDWETALEFFLTAVKETSGQAVNSARRILVLIDPMARKAGQLISRGPRTWLVRVSLGRDPETGTRKYHNRTVHGPFRESQTYLIAKLQERDIGRLPRAAAIRLDDYLDQWLGTSAKPRLRPKSYADYESLLRLHIRPSLGARPLGAITQFDIQSVYAQMFNRGLSPRTIEYTNAVLQSAFRQAVRLKMLAEDPCVGVDLPRLKRREMRSGGFR
jgi:integrase